MPTELYTALFEEFPSVKFFEGSNRQGKMALNRKRQLFIDFLASSPQWAKMIEGLPSDEFLKDVEGLLRPALIWRGASRA